MDTQRGVFLKGEDPPLTAFLVSKSPAGFHQNFLEPDSLQVQWEEAENALVPKLFQNNQIIAEGDAQIVSVLIKNAKYKTQELEAEIEKWTATILQLQTTKEYPNILETLNWRLALRTFFVSHCCTVADCTLWSILTRSSDLLQYFNHFRKSYPHLQRWFTFCCSLPEFDEASRLYVSKLVHLTVREVTELPTSEKWRIIFQQFMSDGNVQEYASPPGLSSEERKILHHLAQEEGIISESRGEGKYRKVVWRKLPREQLVTLASTLKRKFRDDFDIKINMCEEEDFDYFLELYGAQEQFKVLEQLVESVTQDGFVQLYQDVLLKTTNTIQDTDAFKRFHSDKIDWKIYYDGFLSSNTIYCNENSGKTFISIDIKSANFNSLLFYDSSIFGGATSWSQFLNQFTTEPYFHQSKAFRQKVFWLLEPTKINKLSKFIIGEVAKAIVPFYKKLGVGATSRNTDEILLEIPADRKDEVTRQFVEFIRGHPDLQKIHPILRMESFLLHPLSLKKNYYVKIISSESGAEKLEFKGIPIEHFAVCWKHFKKIPLDERDLRLEWTSHGVYKLVDVEALHLC